MSVNQDTLKQIVEAAIMAAEAPLTVPQILGLFPEEARPERERINEVLESLEADTAERGVELRKIGGGYRYQTREHLAPWLRKLNEGRPPRYSRALLETLAIIAYRQPVTRGDVEDIRGVAVSTEIMRTLTEREWIKQVGVRDVPGHPALYGTTPAFLAYFNLQSLKELPALIEQRDLKAIAREQNIELPMDDEADPDAAGGRDEASDSEDGGDALAARADMGSAEDDDPEEDASLTPGDGSGAGEPAGAADAGDDANGPAGDGGSDVLVTPGEMARDGGESAGGPSEEQTQCGESAFPQAGDGDEPGTGEPDTGDDSERNSGAGV